MKKFISFRSLKNYSNEELISFLNDNENVDLSLISGFLSEILRRMNEKNPIFPKKEEENWGTPLTP